MAHDDPFLPSFLEDVGTSLEFAGEVSLGLDCSVFDTVGDFSLRASQSLVNFIAATASALNLGLEEAAAFLKKLNLEVVSGTVDLAEKAQQLLADIRGTATSIVARSLPDSRLVQTLSQLLLNPSRVLGEPCLARAPLLRDLLDLTGLRGEGVLREKVQQIADGFLDFFVPAAATGADLGHFVQAILADPITAALNLVSGQRSQIDCVVTAGLGVGEDVIETQIRHLEEALAEHLS